MARHRVLFAVRSDEMTLFIGDQYGSGLLAQSRGWRWVSTTIDRVPSER